MTNKRKLSEFAGLELDLPKVELPEPSIDISSDDLKHDHSDVEADDEGAMVKADLYKLAKYSVKLFKRIEDEDQFESWVQAKITKAADYISSVYHYLEYEMKFSEYGDKIENSDMYSESEKRQMKNALMEARKTLAALKIDQADRLEKPKTVKEGLSRPCDACGGTGMVEKPLPVSTQKKVEKHRILRNFVQTKIDSDNDGIPDDEEMPGHKFKPDVAKPSKGKSAPKKSSDSSSESKPKSKPTSDSDSSSESKPKKDSGNPFAKKEKSSDSKSSESKPKKEKDDSQTESFFGGSVYGESALNRAKLEWKSAKELMKIAEAKKAKKDYDKDGKIESSEEEHKGAVDKAIKSSKQEKECMNESIELNRLREITSRVIL